jgi:hypothetical protein
LPIGIQLVGDHFQEALLLWIAARTRSTKFNTKRLSVFYTAKIGITVSPATSLTRRSNSELSLLHCSSRLLALTAIRCGAQNSVVIGGTPDMDELAASGVSVENAE